MSADNIGRILGWIVGFLVAAFLLGRFAGNGASGGQVEPADLEAYGMPSPQAEVMARTLNRYGDSARDLPGFQRLVEESESGDEAFTAGLAISFEGVGYLPPLTIDSLAHLRLSLMDEMSTSECARVANSNLEQEQAYRIYGRLDTVNLEHLVRISTRASLARFSKGPLPRVSEPEIEQAWTAFLQTLGEDATDRFLKIVDAILPTDEQLCWAERLFWSTIPRMEPEDKVLLVRTLTQDLGVQ